MWYRHMNTGKPSIETKWMYEGGHIPRNWIIGGRRTIFKKTRVISRVTTHSVWNLKFIFFVYCDVNIEIANFVFTALCFIMFFQ